MIIGIDARIIEPQVKGLGRYGYALLKHLAEIDSSNQYILLTSPLLKAPLFSNSANFLEIPCPGALDEPKNCFSHLSVLDAYDLDIFHALYHFFPRSVRARKKVVTLHDLIWVDTPHLALPNPLSACVVGIWARLFIGRTIRNADAVICISEATRNALQQRYHRTDHVHVIHHGAQSYWHTSLPHSSTQKLSLPQRPFFLMIGHTKPYKNAPFSLRALHLLKKRNCNIDLMFVGRGEGYASLKRLAAKLGLTDQVHFVFRHDVDDEALQRLYRAAIALLQPSLTEGFGAPVVEAMLAGCPLIVSNRASLPELVGDAAPKIDPQNVEAMADAMIRMSGDQQYRQKCIERGLQRVQEFQWKETALKTLEIYRQLHQGNSKIAVDRRDLTR